VQRFPTQDGPEGRTRWTGTFRTRAPSGGEKHIDTRPGNQRTREPENQGTGHGSGEEAAEHWTWNIEPWNTEPWNIEP